jgi:hypothetical protein
MIHQFSADALPLVFVRQQQGNFGDDGDVLVDQASGHTGKPDIFAGEQGQKGAAIWAIQGAKLPKGLEARDLRALIPLVQRICGKRLVHLYHRADIISLSMSNGESRSKGGYSLYLVRIVKRNHMAGEHR